MLLNIYIFKLEKGNIIIYNLLNLELFKTIKIITYLKSLLSRVLVSFIVLELNKRLDCKCSSKVSIYRQSRGQENNDDDLQQLLHAAPLSW